MNAIEALADAPIKTLATAAFVGLLMALLRRAGPRLAGLAAAVPVTSMPTLFWLSQQRGVNFAADAAVASLWATGLTALLALTYARLCLRLRAPVAATLALTGVAALALATQGVTTALVVALPLTVGVIALAMRHSPRSPAQARHAGDWRRDAALAMTASGVMSLLAGELARHSGPALCGVVAAIPIVAMSGVVVSHRQGGTPLAFQFLRGYLNGMLAKATFLAGLAWMLGHGVGLAAWPLAAALALLVLTAQQGLRRVLAAQPRADGPNAVAPMCAASRAVVPTTDSLTCTCRA